MGPKSSFVEIATPNAYGKSFASILTIHLHKFGS
jgi:hypothetical protein